jgi:UDP-N-acetylmuramoylalanine--D-glutamate ligase
VPRGFGPIPGSAARIEFDATDSLPAEPALPGAHNRENAAAAVAAARALELDERAIAEALRTFAGVPHRLETVRELDGVRWVNDSKATNPDSAQRALEAYPAGTLRVILGGSRKQSSFAALAEVARAREVRRAYLIGDTAEELAQALGDAGVDHVLCGDLGTAVALAHADAQPGEIVVLSPACASFDQFRNFEHRGDAFRKLVERL